jgi:DnaK suppressor protein
MGEAEELSGEQLHELKLDLERAIVEAEVGLRTSTIDAQPVDLEAPIGRLSRMDAIQQQQMAGARKARVEDELKALHAALARMRGDTYGECLRCGEPIGFRRLKVKPQATLCLRCQAQRGG